MAYDKYQADEKDKKFGIFLTGEIVKIYKWGDTDEKNRQKVHFIDKYGKAWWEYADRFLKFDDSKLKLRLHYKKSLK